MNIVVEKEPKCVATLRVEIPAEKVHGQRDQIVKSYASKARVQGFRPGKAPRAIIEKRFEKEIREELNEVLFGEAYDAAIKQESLSVLDIGAPSDVATLANGNLTFVAKLTLAPEVVIADYKGISVTVAPMAVPESEIDGQLSALQESFSDFNNIEDRAAEMADFAVIDYTSTIEGLPTEEFLGKPAGYLTGREGFWVRLDEKAFLPGFVVQLVGMNPQDSREITLTLPEDFPEKELRGKEITFQTTLKELKTAVLPVLDDELANRLVPGKTLEDIRTIIRENLQEDRDRKINDQKVNHIVTTLNSMVQFDLPAELVISETQNQADALVKRGVQSGMTQAQIESQQTEIFEQAGEQAITQLRTNFILQEIARMENITISDSELTSHLMQIAQSRKEAPKKVFKEMQRSGRIPSIRSSMAIGKTIDFLLEHANVIEIQESNQND